MEIFQCGTEVNLKRSEYIGVITGVSIRDNRITYEVSYFEGGVYKTNWFNDYEFTVDTENKKANIGFRHLFVKE